MKMCYSLLERSHMELQDLLLAKMKELNTFQETQVSLRSELDALKSMLEEEEHQMSVIDFPFPQTPSSSSNPMTESFPSSIHSVLSESYTNTQIFPPIMTSYCPQPATDTPTEGTSLKEETDAEDTQDQIDPIKRPSSAPLHNSKTPDLHRRQSSFCSLMGNVNPKYISKTPPLARNEKTTAVSSALGYLEISEVDPSGSFVRLINQSLDKEEDIGGCLLQQNIRGHPVSIYRFPPKTRVMARCVVTVWATSAGVAHNPPTDFLWKEQSKFITEPRCTTILCTPNGQALAWFTPLKNKMRKTVEKNLLESELISLVHAPEEWKEDGELITEGDPQSPESPSAHFRLEKVPTLLKREKISLSVLPVTSSPWTQSTASLTHPDFTPSRLEPLGSDGHSHCRQTRLPTAKTEPPSGVPSAGSRHGRDSAISPVSKKSRGPTRSAGPSSRGVLYLGYSAPPGSALHKLFANSSYNIRLASQVSLTPTILSGY